VPGAADDGHAAAHLHAYQVGPEAIEPQAQLSYQKIKFDSFVDVDRITVDLQDGESLRGRVGARIKKAFNPNTSRQWTLYAEGNLVHEFLKDRGITASGISFASDSLGTSAQLGAGFNAQMGANTTLFASVSFSKGLSSGAADTWSGNVGMRFAF
jgi:fibronectin-binding autotransporter adhesin